MLVSRFFIRFCVTLQRTASTKNVFAEEVSAEEVSAEEVSAEEVSAEKHSAEKLHLQKKHSAEKLHLQKNCICRKRNGVQAADRGHHLLPL